MPTITSDTSTEVLATPDLADEMAAGRPYPVRDWSQPLDALSARELLCDLRQWWLDAAQGYLRLAEQGCADSLHDVRTCLAASRHYAPDNAAVL